MAKRLMCKTLGAACLGLSMVWSAPAAFALADIIETPARLTDLAPENLLTDATRVGDRIVAVGERGHIIYSDDEGKTWVQGEVPVSVTLTAIDFGTDTHGWAVGHSGVVLKTTDAGAPGAFRSTGSGPWSWPSRAAKNRLLPCRSASKKRLRKKKKTSSGHWTIFTLPLRTFRRTWISVRSTRCWTSGSKREPRFCGGSLRHVPAYDGRR